MLGYDIVETDVLSQMGFIILIAIYFTIVSISGFIFTIFVKIAKRIERICGDNISITIIIFGFVFTLYFLYSIVNSMTMKQVFDYLRPKPTKEYSLLLERERERNYYYNLYQESECSKHFDCDFDIFMKEQRLLEKSKEE